MIASTILVASGCGGEQSPLEATEQVLPAFCRVVAADEGSLSSLVQLLTDYAGAHGLLMDDSSPDHINYWDKNKKYMVNLDLTCVDGCLLELFFEHNKPDANVLRAFEKVVTEDVASSFGVTACPYQSEIYGWEAIQLPSNPSLEPTP